MAATKPYTVMIDELEHTFLLDTDDAERYAKAYGADNVKAVAAPSNKAAAPSNKA